MKNAKKRLTEKSFGQRILYIVWNGNSRKKVNNERSLGVYFTTEFEKILKVFLT